MGRKIGLLLMVIGIPALGYGAARGCQGLLDAQVRDAARSEFSTLDDEQIASITVADLCERPRLQNEDLCTTAGNLVLIERASVGAGAVGLALLALIWMAGRIARRRRRLLLYLFKPGLYLTAVVLVGLVITYAGISMGALYYGESLFLGRVHVVLIGGIGLGAIVGAGSMAENVFRIVNKVETTAIGTSVTRDEAPDLWATVEDLANEIGSLLPDHIVFGVEPNFYVTEARVTCLEGSLSGRTLYCSLPLLRILEKDEARAIIAHELAHFEGDDTKYSRHFYPVYRGSYGAINSLVETGEGCRGLALLPAIAIFRMFINSFSVAEREIGRAREIRADAEATALCGPRALGTGLVKVHAFSAAWPVVQESSVDLLQRGQMLTNMSMSFTQTAQQAARPDVLDGIDDERMSHPTDTHPPLSKRLEALGLALEDLATEALEVSPAEPATGFVTGVEEKEESISGAYQLVLAGRLGIDIQPAG